jgi:uncharacterized DUF497 family protein
MAIPCGCRFFYLFGLLEKKNYLCAIHQKINQNNMDFIFSKHAEEQMLKRGINREAVVTVISQPDEMVIDDEDSRIVIFQSLVEENEQKFLLRVFINRNKQPNVIVTLYKTTKITKYYEGKI